MKRVLLVILMLSVAAWGQSKPKPSGQRLGESFSKAATKALLSVWGATNPNDELGKRHVDEMLDNANAEVTTTAEENVMSNLIQLNIQRRIHFVKRQGEDFSVEFVGMAPKEMDCYDALRDVFRYRVYRKSKVDEACSN